MIKKIKFDYEHLEDKIQLTKMVLDIEDESLIEQVKSFLLPNQEEELPKHVKESIIRSISQANSRNLISLAEFKTKHFSKK